MSNWSGLDFFIFLIFFLNLVLGASRGATKEIVSMMCLSVALIFTIKFTIPLTKFLNTSPLIQNVLQSKIIQNFMNAIGAGPLTADMLAEMTYCISLGICFVGVFSACEAMLSVVGFKEVFSFPYAALNRKVGAALGTVRGYVLATILVSMLIIHIFKHNEIKDSYFVDLLRSSAYKLDSIIRHQQVERYGEIYNESTKYNESNVYQTVPPPNVNTPSNVNTNPGTNTAPANSSFNAQPNTNTPTNTYPAPTNNVDYNYYTTHAR
ncbi:MAG: CvpA family protein [Gammaproteobacteria bacterium]